MATLNSETIATTDTGITANANALVGVNSATTVSTGLTNNFLTDSFFLPLLIAIIGVWMYRSGLFAGVIGWFDGKKSKQQDYLAQKTLQGKIVEIQRKEGSR